jgi:Cu+-exporting ATPase
MYNDGIMETWTIQLSGMHCDGCIASVSAALESIPGIDLVQVTLADQQAVVSAAEGIEEQSLCEAVERAGFQVLQLSIGSELPIQPIAKSPSPLVSDESSQPALVDDYGDRLELEIEGMHCASCVSQVRGALMAVTGVRQAGVNLATRQASVVLESSSVTPGQLMEAVQRAGYSARESQPLPTQAARLDQRIDQEQRRWRNRCLLAVTLTLVQLIVRYTSGYLLVTAATSIALAAGLAIQLYVGAPFYRDAWRRLRAGSTSMDTLVVVGTTAAFCSALPGLLSEGLQAGVHGLGMLQDAGMIFSFISLGRYLESRSRRRASQAMQQLLRRIPETVQVRRESLQMVPVADVQVGETIIVPAGHNVSLDGRVTEGTSELDESWLTGESMPVSRSEGDLVYAGTINGSGALQVVVTSRVESTSFARVVELVNRLQQEPAPIQRLADRLVSVFVPIVLVLALATYTGWYLASDGELAIRCTIALLVVACPCALGLATPIALLVAGGRGASIGLLIQQPQSLESAAGVNLVVFDKTGTITLGEPRVEEILVADGIDRGELLATAAAVERLSSHPLAQAVVIEAERLGCTVETASDVVEVAGRGIEAVVSGRQVVIGNDHCLEQLPAGKRDVEGIDRLRTSGRSLVHIVIDGRWIGTLAIADAVRPESRATVAMLHKMGIRTMLLSGDQPEVVSRIGQEVNIQECRGGMTPEGKCDVIRELGVQGHSVAVVGDGINDAPALVAAEVGIAIGSGADVAKQSADIVLISAQLSGVVEALQLSRHTIRIIRQNLAWAVLYNICLLPLAAGVVELAGTRGIPVWLAAMAMSASSLMVVLNSLRLARVELAAD